MINEQIVIDALKQAADDQRAKNLSRFFKTGKGEYGYGDIFLGVSVPQQRIIAKRYATLSLNSIANLLASPYHECRLTALIILTIQFQKADREQKERIFNVYLSNTQAINNWDLVDSSAHKIVGAFLLDKDLHLLTKLAQSKNLWERRIAIIATFAFIKERKFNVSLHIARILMHDTHDLIHKAVGWTLREIGKQNESLLTKFLNQYAATMPRIMLRYAIEKLHAEKKEYFMKLKTTPE